jgi:hypothetical protein
VIKGGNAEIVPLQVCTKIAATPNNGNRAFQEDERGAEKQEYRSKNVFEHGRDQLLKA